MATSSNEPTKLQFVRKIPARSVVIFGLIVLGFLFCAGLFIQNTPQDGPWRIFSIIDPRSKLPILINSTATPEPTSGETHQLQNSSHFPSSRINPHPFSCPIKEARFCQQADPTIPLLIACVDSSPGGFEYRKAIRATWANTSQWGNVNGLASSVDMRILFAVGFTTNSTVMDMIKEESDRYHDIMQCDYIDSYKNVSYKDVTWLKWVSTECSHAYQVMKVDEDTFINPFTLVPMIRNFYDHGHARHRTFTCRTWTEQYLDRDKTHKYYVSYEEYAKEKYPIYCNGPAYLMSTDLAPLLYEKSLDTKFFYLDDVYVTGILAEQLENVVYQDIGQRGLVNYACRHDLKDWVQNLLSAHLTSRFDIQYTAWEEVWSVFTNPSFVWPKPARAVPNVVKVA